MLSIALPNNPAIDKTLILLTAWASSERGMVFVTTSSSSLDSLIRSTAGPDNTACEAHA